MNAERLARAGRVYLPVVNGSRPALPVMAPHDTTARMTRALAEQIAGTLGTPSKMPGFSYGLSAQLCNVGGRLRDVPGSVCSKCYATNDWYRTWKPLLAGHARRELGLRHPRWIEAMVFMMNTARVRAAGRWFRWHDSGDLRGVWHLDNIVEVCRRTPHLVHWLPTREYDVVRDYLALRAYTTKPALPENLVIRLSALMIDQPTCVDDDLTHFPTSTVTSGSRYGSIRADRGHAKGDIECPASRAEVFNCHNCRACWDPRVRNVAYVEH